MVKPIPHKFRYTLKYGDTDYVLPNSPDGWMRTTIQYGRSDSYGGVIRALTLPYTFPRGAAKLLRKAYYQPGTPRMPFYIDVRNEQWGYNRLFTGKIDFRTKKDRRTGFEVSAVEDNIISKIDAYEDVEYALPLVGDDVFDLTLTPIRLKEIADYIATPRSDFAADGFPGLQLINNQQQASVVSSQRVDYDQVTNPDYGTSIHWFYQAAVDGIWNGDIHIDARVRSNFPSSNHYQLNIYKSTGELVKTVVDMNGIFNDIGISLDVSVAIPMLKGQRLFLYSRDVDGTPQPNTGFKFTSDTTIKSYYNTESPATTCKAILAKDVYKRLIAKIDPLATAQSLMLETEFARLAFTCSNSILTPQVGNTYMAGDDLQVGGTYLVIAAPITYVNEQGIQTVYDVGEYFKAIPGYDSFSSFDEGFARLLLAEPQLLISFKDLFQDFFGLKCGQVGFGLDIGKACLEDLTYFYRGGLLTYNFGKNVSEVEITPNTKRQYTAIKVGHQDQQYNTLNGAQEAMSTQNYTTPYEDAKLELNAVTAHRFDPLGIEEIRAVTANIDGNTASSRSDNNVWGIMMHPTENRPYTVAEGTQSYGGVDGSYYNWQISPSQNLRRGSRFLASCMDRLNGNITFRGGDKNVSMFTIDLNGNRVAEGESLVIANLGQKIFRPELFTFTCDGGNGADLMMRPYGYVAFTDRKAALKGFIVDVSVDEGSKTSQKFTLECCGDVDFGKLIR